MKTNRTLASALVCIVLLGLAGVAYLQGWMTQPEILLPDETSLSNDWPWWRGVKRDNIAIGPSPPVSWDEQHNVIWKADIPGRGHGSPIILSDRIFLATADELKEVQSLVCIARDSGKLLWNRTVHENGFVHKNIKNSHASATPATDGHHVFVPFVVDGGLWVTATNLDGTVLWQQLIAPFQSEHGYASSPLIYKSLVIVAGDNLAQSYLTALDRATGQPVWRAPRKQGGSYATPIVATLSGRPQLVMSGQNSVTSYNPDDGTVLWYCSGPADSTIGTIAWWNDFVFATAGAQPMRAGTMCIRTDGHGDVSQTHVAWENKATANVPSPLVFDNSLLVVQDIGIVTSLSLETGDQLWKKRLGGSISASPVTCGGYVFLPNEAGRMFVFKASGDFEMVAQNDLNDGGFASPVICGARLYIRTEHHLFCIGEDGE